MERTNFENLRVYKLAEGLSDRIWEIVVDWEYLAKDTVGKQMIKAADSIGANIAEGTGRGSPEDNRRFIRMARGSLYETQHWLRRAYKRGLLIKHQVVRITPIVNELSPTLNAYYRSVDAVARDYRKQRTKHKVPRSKV